MRFSVRAWKKASLGSVQQSRRRCAHSISNIWLDYIRQPSGVAAADLGPGEKVPAILMFKRNGAEKKLPSKLWHKRFPIMVRTTSTKQEPLMVTARSRRTRSRTSKSRRKLSESSNHPGPSRLQATNDYASLQVDETDNFLLSSLRYWEVDRDLIEERRCYVAASFMYALIRNCAGGLWPEACRRNDLRFVASLGMTTGVALCPVCVRATFFAKSGPRSRPEVSGLP